MTIFFGSLGFINVSRSDEIIMMTQTAAKTTDIIFYNCKSFGKSITIMKFDFFAVETPRIADELLKY